MNLLTLEIPNRCRRFSERVGPGYLPFIAAAVVLAAVQALPADRRRLVRGHVQELRRHHRDDAPVELAEVLDALAGDGLDEMIHVLSERGGSVELSLFIVKALVLRHLRAEANLVRDAEKRRRDVVDRLRRERQHLAALARNRAIEEIRASEVNSAPLMPGLEQVELTPEQWEALV